MCTKGQLEKPRHVASATETAQTSSVFKKGSRSFLSGARVRLTATMSAAGTVASICIIVTGYNLREVKHSSGMVVIEVPGLCIGAASDPRLKEIGYLVLLHSEVLCLKPAALKAIVEFFWLFAANDGCRFQAIKRAAGIC